MHVQFVQPACLQGNGAGNLQVLIVKVLKDRARHGDKTGWLTDRTSPHEGCQQHIYRMFCKSYFSVYIQRVQGLGKI